MFDIGMWELVLIFLLAIVIIGPKRLPEVASKLGQWISKFKQAQRHFHQMFNHYTNYPNAGKHLLNIDSKSENSKDFTNLKNEFNEIKQQVESDLNQSTIPAETLKKSTKLDKTDKTEKNKKSKKSKKEKTSKVE